MKFRIVTICLVFTLTVSTLLPSAAAAHKQQSPFQQNTVQGEIAYIKDGDIWLLDLFTGKSQQLTTDGDNRWPTWSTDGRYLLYTRGDPEVQADLYLLAVGQGAPKLLAENACCAAWSFDQARIAYLSLGGAELAIATVQPNGADPAIAIPAVSVGRSSTPTGNLLWIPATESVGNTDQFLVPLQVIGGASGGLARSEGVFGVEATGRAPSALYGDKATCFWRNYTVIRVDGSLLEAIAFTGSAACGGETQHDKGIRITKDAQPDRELPWLAYPTWSSDGQSLAAERYQEASDPTRAVLAGIVIHSLADDSEQMVVEGGAQPAWRPGSSVDPLVARYLQTGERAIAIQPALTWQGATYQVYYLTTGAYRKNDASLFTPTTPAFFADQGITALIVTKDGQVVTDADTLRQVFLGYTAAYYLYEKPPEEFVPAGREELGNVLNNPIFQALSVGELLRTPRAQTAETLRAMLTDGVSKKTTLEPLFDQAFATTPKGAEAALDAFGAVVENQAAHDAVLLALKPDLAAAYANLADTVKGSKYELQLIRLALQLLFTSHLQAERARWLESYADAFTDGAGSLDRNQLNAAADVLTEVQSSDQQRIDIAADFMTGMSSQMILDLSGAAATKAATQLLTQISEKFGVRLASNAVAGILASVSLGATLGNLLYGSDELFAHFTLAQRADELRTTFHAGRTALQEKASFEKAKAPATLVYNGDLAAQFRAAWLLETLAAVQTQRAYATGAAATIRLPNLLEVITKLLGQDWKTAVQGLQQRADEIEIKVLNQVGAPDWLETALGLALNRMPKGPTVIVGTPIEPSLPKLHPEWTSYTNGNFVNDLLVEGNIVWAATDGGVVRWDTINGSYVKFTTEYGLVDNHVTSIAHSSDGALWFGTWSGVSRLDGNGQWTNFTTADGLVYNNVLDITQAADGSMWFGTSEGVSHLESNGRWTTFTTPVGLASGVTSIYQTVDGAIWFGTFHGGVSRLDNKGHWITFTKENGLAANWIEAIAQSADGNMWFGTWGSISQFDVNGRWTTITNKDGLGQILRITSIVQDDNESIWFGTDGVGCYPCGNGVSRMDKDGQWTTFNIEDGLGDNWVEALAEGTDGTLWFGTYGGGISRLNANGQWTTFVTADGLAANRIVSTLLGTDDALWFNTTNNIPDFNERHGVSRLNRDERWTTFTPPDSLGSLIPSIGQSADGAFWFSTFKGVNRLDTNGRWTVFTTDDGLASDYIHVIVQSNDGSIWFGTGRPNCIDCGKGVSRLNTEGYWTTYTVADGLVNDNVIFIMQSADGSMWFGTYDGGIGRLDADGRWSSFTTKDGLVDNTVNAIIQSADSALWFGTRSGVSRLDKDSSWTTFTTASGLAGNSVNAITQSSNGSIWFGTNGGVSRLDNNGRWTNFTTKDGLANNSILSIIQNAEGELWFGTYSGISRLSAGDNDSKPNSPSPDGTTSTWEYQAVDGGSALGNPAGIATLLNPLGQAGWDMAGVTATIFIMKRALANPGAWEYQIVNGNPAAVGNLLNPLGEEGWEVAGVTATFFILKRPLVNPGAWEYQSVTLTGDPASTGAVLHPLGQQGWDIAGTTGPFLILKRPLIDPVVWEYQIVDGGGVLLGGDPADVANLLNPLGHEGWEMAGATATVFILRRSLANPGQWEYQMVDGGRVLGGDPAALAALLNPLGQAGWEVAGVTGPILILKRVLVQ